ncbi:beta-ketoacyl synthase N-terminal-like domain-containing protein [uncultured Paraglaciecola sp.]|uniref:beta-ketoacyl synthase N-terminal-like domain-containing protein n=1 Tax=uncultured Paraglaciecola sp. TaxID=1765024 RepID=UPI00261877C1|nr:beta-ketoacyl synthase N-terminal-like domain-containing protein [uncultured Paraglaciecola sp.]
MPVYIHSSVSHSACGNSYVEPQLTFSTQANTQLTFTTGVEEQAQIASFFAMDKLPLNNTEARLFTSLSTVVAQLIKTSGLTPQQLSQTALMLGSTSLDIGTLSPDTDKALGLPKIDRLSEYLQQKFSLHPYHLVINTACTASLNAVLYAKKLLQSTDIKQVIVIGCEFYNQLTTSGFHSLDLLSSEQLLAFHQERQGLILGEGIGALLLSNSQPKDKACYRVLEGDSACDTSSLTMTAEDGSHIHKVMSQAVKESGLRASNIDLIKVHGTATYNNDISEYHALKSYFNDPPPIMALKPFIGHTLGACGVIELALMDYLLSQQSIPVADYVTSQPHVIMLPFAPLDKAISQYQYLLVNHSGFGGNNAALVLETIQACN